MSWMQICHSVAGKARPVAEAEQGLHPAVLCCPPPRKKPEICPGTYCFVFYINLLVCGPPETPVYRWHSYEDLGPCSSYLWGHWAIKGSEGKNLPTSGMGRIPRRQTFNSAFIFDFIFNSSDWP